MFDSIFNVFVGLAGLYFLWKQNRIFEKQNEIFAVQAGRKKELTPPLTRAKRYWPMAAMAVMTVVLWLGLAYRYYEARHPPPLPEFDAPQNAVVMQYGMPIMNTCAEQVNGHVLLPYQADYKAAIACFIYDGNGPILDAPNIQVSQLYDVIDGTMDIRQQFSDSFIQYRSAHGAVGINIALLLIPNGIDRDQFTTLRQARRLKISIPELSTASAATVVGGK